ncbi:MAG: helix-turn-helix transcriptional regulator [Pyrinomonadaceae bacterium]|nr:helix-turn-helix transcriptional regulator [Pyrinomonadaceae bacterium]
MAETLGELIKRRMKDLDIKNNSELGRMLKLSDAYIGDLVNDRGKTKSGTYKPRPATLAKLARVLRVSELEILNAVGYTSQEKEVQTYQIAPGVTLTFDKTSNWQDEEINKFVETVEIIANGIKLDNKNFTVNDKRVDMKGKYGEDVLTEKDLQNLLDED